MGNFDPYQAWLDISSDQQPATYYRLLGIREFESDPQTISSAADRVLGHLSQFQNGSQAADCGRLMQEVQAARVCLLDAGGKSQYDSSLRQSRQGGAAGAAPGIGEDASMYPPGWQGRKQQIGQVPSVPDAYPPQATGPEQPMGPAPPVPTGLAPSGTLGSSGTQERQMAGPAAGPRGGPVPAVPGGPVSGSGERPLQPPPGVPGRTSGRSQAGSAPPPGQQLASPGLPGSAGSAAGGPLPSGPSAETNERPMSGPMSGIPATGGAMPRSTPSRPMPRDASTTTGSPAEAPGAPLPGMPTGGPYPGTATYGQAGPAATQQPGATPGVSAEQPMQQPVGAPLPQAVPGAPIPGQMPGAVGPGSQPYGQAPVQQVAGYGQPSAPGSMPTPAGPAVGASGPPVQPPGAPQSGAPSWAPERRTGQVGTSVADVVAGTAPTPERTTYATREGRRPRRKSSSSTYQAMVIVLAAAIVLVGFILALIIAQYVL